MATVQLRLRGATPMHLVSAAISAFPIVYIDYQLFVHHARPTLALWMLSGAVAVLPWISRAIARATYRAKCDDVAVHVRGEALPYKTITSIRLTRTPRRTTLHLIRSETIQLQLVLRDAFAGRLEPIAELDTRLRTHGHNLNNL
jgi:hypothetical protein